MISGARSISIPVHASIPAAGGIKFFTMIHLGNMAFDANRQQLDSRSACVVQSVCSVISGLQVDSSWAIRP